jgi:hypothetical protein
MEPIFFPIVLDTAQLERLRELAAIPGQSVDKIVRDAIAQIRITQRFGGRRSS